MTDSVAEARSREGWMGFGDAEAVACPLCTDGDMIGEVGSGHAEAHLTKGWIDNLTDTVSVAAVGGLTIQPTVNESPDWRRGSHVGWECVFEQCLHVIQYRVQFHKGAVYWEWRQMPARKEDEWSELPRT
jgi:hypothetical protein